MNQEERKILREQERLVFQNFDEKLEKVKAFPKGLKVLTSLPEFFASCVEFFEAATSAFNFLSAESKRLEAELDRREQKRKDAPFSEEEAIRLMKSIHTHHPRELKLGLLKWMEQECGLDETEFLALAKMLKI